jgi:glycosyltransferase involved in cell wall biosynthesis
VKIAVVTDSYAPYVDGVARYLNRVVQLLSDRGHKVLIIGPGFSFRTKYEFEQNNVGIVRNPSLWMLRLNEYYPSLPSRASAQIIKWADVVFSPSLAPLGIYSIIYANRVHKPMAFFCVHDELVLLGTGIWLPLPKRLVSSIIRALYKRCPVIFFATQRFREKILKLGISENKLIYDPYGIEFDFFSSGNKALGRKRLAIPQNAKTVLYLGRMSEEKNVRTLIATIPQVAKHIPDLYYVFAGHGPKFDEYRKEAIAVEKKSGAKVIFTGLVDFKDLPDTYAVGDIFVHPSLHEAQSFTVLEAMCAGEPAITAAEEGKYSFLKKGQNVEFVKDVLDCDELSKKIIELLKDDERRKRMGKNAVVIARQHSWDAHIDKLEEGFMRAIKAKRGASPKPS